MTLPSYVDRIYSMVECLCTTVQDYTGMPLCWCGFVPGGTPAYDGCNPCSSDACGMGFVTLNNAGIGAALNNPGGARGAGNCHDPLQAQLTAGVLRCWPLEEDGSGPSTETAAEIGLLLLSDMQAIRQAVACCYGDGTYLNGYTPIGPDGGCIGGAWTFAMDLEA